MKFGRNQPRSQPIVRVARLAGPELVALLHSRHTSAFVVCFHLTPPLSCRQIRSKLKVVGAPIRAGRLSRRRATASALPLRALDRDVLERRRIGEAGDLAEGGLAHPRADAVEEGEFPDRRIDRFLVDQPLHLFKDRRPLFRV